MEKESTESTTEKPQQEKKREKKSLQDPIFETALN